MSVVYPDDSDYRVCEVEFGTLVELQLDAEKHGWATRWTSMAALRSQVKEGSVVLQPLLREMRGPKLLSYRCLLLFSAANNKSAGGIATIDVDPSKLESLERIDRDAAVRAVFARVFTLAAGGISMVSKS